MWCPLPYGASGDAAVPLTVSQPCTWMVVLFLWSSQPSNMQGNTKTCADFIVLPTRTVTHSIHGPTVHV